MGSLLGRIEKLSPTESIKIFKDFLTHEKMELLKLVNQDYIMDVETFCSFFLINENMFSIFDTNKNGLVSLLDIFMLMFLVKNDSFSTKINSKQFYKTTYL